MKVVYFENPGVREMTRFVFPDPRTRDWPLVDIRIGAAMTVSYLLIVPIGIHLMRKRAPFKLKFFTTIHNTILFLLSLYMCIETIKQVQQSQNTYPSKHAKITLSLMWNSSGALEVVLCVQRSIKKVNSHRLPTD